MEGAERVTPDKERAKAMLRSVEDDLEAIESVDRRHASFVLRGLYEAVRRLMEAVVMLDGWRTRGEGSHARVIEYMEDNYGHVLTDDELQLLKDVREKRNRISYRGSTVNRDYLERKEPEIKRIVEKLERLARKKAGL